MNYEKYNNCLPYASRLANRREHEAFWEESNRLKEQFKSDLFMDLNINNNPKRELLFEKSWQLGHSYGYYEVHNIAQDLVDLIL